MTKDTKALAAIAIFNSVIAGMIAENKQREYLNNSMAYCEDSFAVEKDKFEVAIRKIEDIQEKPK